MAEPIHLPEIYTNGIRNFVNDDGLVMLLAVNDQPEAGGSRMLAKVRMTLAMAKIHAIQIKKLLCAYEEQAGMKIGIPKALAAQNGISEVEDW